MGCAAATLENTTRVPVMDLTRERVRDDDRTRRLDGNDLLPKLILGVKFADGLEVGCPDETRGVFYTTTQGSRVMSYAFF
jgi:hypothetical protein